MTLDVKITFPGSASASAAVSGNLVVRRFELREHLSSLFELTVEVLSPDPSLDEKSIVGEAVVVDLGDEPFVKQIHGLVRRMEQRTAVVDGDSLYAWTIVPPLWLTTRRRDHRIFQDKSAPEIAAEVVAGYGGRIPAPDTARASSAPKREYVVQYGETDHQFLSRILADEGITSSFDHEGGGTWTLTLDTTSATRSAGTIPFSDPRHMNPVVSGKTATPHVQTAVLCSAVETSAVTLRDFDFERPDLLLEAKKEAGSGAFTSEHPLESYAYEVGRFADQGAGDTRAGQRLEAHRADRRLYRCTTSFALAPSAKLTLIDHPRADLAGDLLVVSAHTVMEEDDKGSHELTLMDLSRPYRPSLLPKPRIHGAQTGIVVGAEGQEIDVDKHGRVEVEFRWDRRDKHVGGICRRVRVSQGWAGADRGFVMLPRIKDEVIVAYLDGDPDQPIIVGRVHNGASVSPLNLPADKAISVWRSKSTPGGAGFNEILMDDAAGAERLTMHAQRDWKQVVERDAETVIGRNETRTVKGNRTLRVLGNQTERVTGDKTIKAGGVLNLQGKTVNLVSDLDMDIHSGAHMQISCDTNRDDTTVGFHTIKANVLFLNGDSVAQVSAPVVRIFGGSEIHLGVGNSTIHITAGGIKITSAGDVEVNGATVKLNCD